MLQCATANYLRFPWRILLLLFCYSATPGLFKLLQCCCWSCCYLSFCSRQVSPVVTDREKTDQGYLGNRKRTGFSQISKAFQKRRYSPGQDQIQGYATNHILSRFVEEVKCWVEFSSDTRQKPSCAHPYLSCGSIHNRHVWGQPYSTSRVSDTTHQKWGKRARLMLHSKQEGIFSISKHMLLLLFLQYP